MRGHKKMTHDSHGGMVGHGSEEPSIPERSVKAAFHRDPGRSMMTLRKKAKKRRGRY